MFSKVRPEEIDSTQNLVRALHPHRYSERVMEWFIHPRIASALESILGRPALGAQTMYYYKPPGATGQGMHQDNFYLLAKPAACIAAWTPLDDADEENGCLLVVPGSHRWDIVCTGHEGKSWTVNEHGVIGHFPPGHKPEPVRVRRGQTMLFGGKLIHGSGPNRSKDRWRRTFIGHYVDQATDTLSRFYHPVVNMRGEVVSTVAEHTGGGPCGDSWAGAVH
jgi:ectoine hydroxylase-related dioxygenase (phytanoyl-CoA dioxygenase family)